jgi:plastocyanin
LKYLGIFLAVVILGGGAYLLFNGSDTEEANPAPAARTERETGDDSQAAAPNEQPAAAATVTYTDSGFSPATVTIKRGQTVRFTNQTDGPMWVASDDHPVHNDLPGFDALGDLGRGQSYEFTFDTAGTWGYHNHSASVDRGTVIVE